MIKIKLSEGFLNMQDIYYLGIKRTSLKNYFHDHRGIMIHVLSGTWEWCNQVPDNYLSPSGFRGFLPGDKFSVSVTEHVDDRLAAGSQAFTETFDFQVSKVNGNELKVIFLEKKENTTKQYPKFGKN